MGLLEIAAVLSILSSINSLGGSAGLIGNNNPVASQSYCKVERKYFNDKRLRPSRHAKRPVKLNYAKRRQLYIKACLKK